MAAPKSSQLDRYLDAAREEGIGHTLYVEATTKHVVADQS